MAFQPPFAQVQTSVNSGGNVTGAIDNVAASATIALSGVNTTGWATALWEIYDYPIGFSTPSGWALQASGSITFNGSQATPNPPTFTLPTTATWGKFAIRLTVNGGQDPTGANNSLRMIDESCAISMLSPSGLHDGFAGETSQFGGALRLWTGDYKKNLRVIENAFSGSGFSMAGDVIGTTGASIVKQITGVSNTLVMLAGVVNFSNGLASVTFNQSAVSSTPGSNFNISAQTSTAATGVGGNLVLNGGGATGATSGTPGNVIAQTGAPSGSGSHGFFVVQENGTPYVTAGRYVSGGADGVLYMGQGVVPSSTNYTLYSDGTTATGLNTPSQGYLQAAATTCFTWTATALSPFVSTMQWQQGLTPILNQVQQANGSNPANFVVSPQQPGAGASTGPTGTPGSFVVNVFLPVSTGAEAALMFERNSVPLFRAQALTSSTGYGAIYMGNVTPSGTNYTFADDGVTQLAINAPAGTQINFNMGGTASVALSLNNFQWATGVSVPTINQAASSGAAQTFFITAQAAGGTNDGGALSLGGGAHAGSSTVDGSVLITTPLNMGELTFTPAAGSQTLTNAQSDANVILLGTQASAFTINYLRRIADKSALFVRNPSGNGTATIAYLTGGTVTVAAATSALIVSDGSNLQKIMIGT